MKTIRSILPYLAIVLIAFYVLPLAINDTGSGMLVLLIAVPLICFIGSLVLGVRNGFQFVFPVLTAVLFIPSIFIFYNETAWVYGVAYFIISLIGNLIGMLFRKRRK